MKEETRKRMIEYTVYIASDGKEYSSMSECERHEKAMDLEAAWQKVMDMAVRMNSKQNNCLSALLDASYDNCIYYKATFKNQDDCENARALLRSLFAESYTEPYALDGDEIVPSEKPYIVSRNINTGDVTITNEERIGRWVNDSLAAIFG